jgi:hypothetical protein
MLSKRLVAVRVTLRRLDATPRKPARPVATADWATGSDAKA